MRKIIDLTGKKFGRLRVIKRAGRNKRGDYIWLCLCECNNLTKVVGGNLRSGGTKSCGCLQKEICKIIGQNRRKYFNNQRFQIYSKEYRIWANLKDRCLNKNCKDYKYYGGRGITVCKSWLKFKNFYEDMGDRPSDKNSIDRIQNNLGYSKENCHWATRKEQGRNQRTNRMITYQEKTLCLAEWAEKLDINYFTLKSRLDIYDWSIKRAFTK